MSRTISTDQDGDPLRGLLARVDDEFLLRALIDRGYSERPSSATALRSAGVTIL